MLQLPPASVLAPALPSPKYCSCSRGLRAEGLVQLILGFAASSFCSAGSWRGVLSIFLVRSICFGQVPYFV